MKGSMELRIKSGQISIKHVAMLSLLLFASLFAPFYTQKAFANQVLTAPVLASPGDNAFTNGNSYFVSWGAVDGAAKYQYASYNHINALGQPSGQRVFDTAGTTQTKRVSSNVPDGHIYWWRVRAVDANGTPGAWSGLWKMTIDNINPDIYSSTAALQPNDNSVTITGSITEPHLESVSLKLDGTDVDSSAVTLTGNDFTAELQNLSVGNHTVEITATDKAGNKSAVRTHAFTVTDTIAPVITITSPTTFVEGEDVVITGTATDNHSLVDEVSVHVDGAEKGTATVTNGEFSHSLGQLAPGAYEITAKGTDAAGNEATSAPVTLTITAKPVVTPPIVVNPETPDPTPADPTPAEPTPSPQSQPAPTRAAYLQPAANTAQTTTDTPDDEEATVEVEALALNPPPSPPT